MPAKKVYCRTQLSCNIRLSLFTFSSRKKTFQDELHIDVLLGLFAHDFPKVFFKTRVVVLLAVELLQGDEVQATLLLPYTLINCVVC